MGSGPIGNATRLAAQLVLVLLGISTALFFLIRLSGDPIALLAGPDAGPAVIASIRQQLGLDDPLWIQYGRFLGALLRLDFGNSFRTHQPAMPMVLEQLPSTLELGGLAILLAVMVGVPAGVLAAARRGPVSSVVFVLALLGQSIPNFALGILLIVVFAVGLHLLPSFGHASAAAFVLPVVTLAAYLVAKLARLARSGVLETLGEDYVRTARAKGLPPGRVLWRHAVRNALLPVLSVLGIELSYLVSGSVIVETVFAWPGVGRQLIQAVTARDYPVVQAATFLIAVLVVLINLAVDVAYRVADPRLRQG